MKKELEIEKFENVKLAPAAKEMHGNGSPDYASKLCDFEKFLKTL